MPPRLFGWTYHHMVYKLRRHVQSVSAFWNIHSTIRTLKIIFLTFPMHLPLTFFWLFSLFRSLCFCHHKMLLIQYEPCCMPSGKHLAVETPDHGWSFNRQVRAAKSLLMTTVITKNFVWGQIIPQHAAPDFLLVPVPPGESFSGNVMCPTSTWSYPKLNVDVCCHMLFSSCLFDLPTPPTFSNLLANGLTVWSPRPTFSKELPANAGFEWA